MRNLPYTNFCYLTIGSLAAEVVLDGSIGNTFFRFAVAH
jgi:hypothetical protein